MRKTTIFTLLTIILTATGANAVDDFQDLDPVTPEAFPLKPMLEPDLMPPDSNPLKTLRENSPNFSRGAVQNSLDLNGSRLDPYSPDPDTPHGNDIRDYNPYYNRDGSLKR